MFTILERTIFSVCRIVLCVVVGHASIGLAQSSGTFTATGSMIAPRVGHTATLLPNGKVLIAGGIAISISQSVLASTELYDPSTGMFAATGNMTTARARHSATLLPDGQVLIAGGSTDLIAEIYDPSTGMFTTTGKMVASPYSSLPVATLLYDGRVFIAGQPTAQIYESVTGTFVATATYAAPAPSFMESTALLADGRVLLTGGGDTSGWSELYDPISGTFSLAGSMNFWSDVYTTTLLPSGRVLFVGNNDGDGTPANAEVFDPVVGTFTRIHSAAANHEYAAAALLPDGTVLITGCQLLGADGGFVSELYTPASGTFSSTASMITGRFQHTATLLADGTVLIAGGFSSAVRIAGFGVSPRATSSAELYHPAVLTHAPLLFSLSGDGKGQSAIWHAATGEIASSSSPAVAGETLSMYTTNLVDGGAIPPQVAIGGRLAEILHFEAAPGYPGYNQVNFRVPSGVGPGPAVSVRLTYISRPSNEVTIGLR